MKERLRVNHQIRIPYVRLIVDGKQMGVVKVEEAKKLSVQMGLDLVEIAPNERPPVCKIMDFGKFKYEQQKKQNKPKTDTWKEIRLSPVIQENDIDTKIGHLRRFLEKGNHVKVLLKYRGRQMAHVDEGKAVMERVLSSVGGLGKIESHPKLEGKNLVAVVSPISSNA